MNFLNNIDWTLARYKDKSPVDIGPHILSFAVVKRLLYSSTHFITKCAFTSILPYPATEYNSIFTTMIQSFLGTPFFDIASRVFWGHRFLTSHPEFFGTPFFDIASRVFLGHRFLTSHPEFFGTPFFDIASCILLASFDENHEK